MAQDNKPMVREKLQVLDADEEDEQVILDAMSGSPNGHSGSPGRRGRSRSDWVGTSISPGPAAYSPKVQSVKKLGERAVFGTSRRDNEQKRFISNMHNLTIPPGDTPGPGTYRTHVTDAYAHSPKNKAGPSWKFGTEPQRMIETVEAAKIPGPIYDLNDTNESPRWTFAPQGSMELGMTRSRTDTSKVFLSKMHAAAEHLDAADTPGPNHYELLPPEVESPKRRNPAWSMGKQSKDAFNSLDQMQMQVDPRFGTAIQAPGHVYDHKSTLNTTISSKFGTGPRTYSPERGGNQAGPYISRMHAMAQPGNTSPGPAAYSIEGGRNKAVRGIGDAPTPKFGTEIRNPGHHTIVPGPGAYQPKNEVQSRAMSAPAYSVASNLRTDFTTMSGTAAYPGPGAYDVQGKEVLESNKQHPPAYSLGATSGSEGRTSFVPRTIGPGPGGYMLAGAIDTSPRKGYSFGIKEKTVDPRSTISVRFHGRLASQEAMGTQSPGPGVYDTRAGEKFLAQSQSNVKFGTSTRQADSRMYISPQHAAVDGSGLDSPGPCGYNAHSAELSQVTSKFRKSAGMRFGTSPRFKMNYMTF